MMMMATRSRSASRSPRLRRRRRRRPRRSPPRSPRTRTTRRAPPTAWARYPASPALADLALGAPLERAVVQACLGWVRQKIDREPSTTLAATVTRTEAKDNVVSGAVHVALGVARAALATRARLAKN